MNNRMVTSASLIDPVALRHGDDHGRQKSSSQSAASFRISGVGKSYQSTPALHPTDLTVEAGEYLILLGPSGSGKTTLLMMLAGFVEPSVGNIFCGGVDITDLPPERRGFGVVFQGYALFPHLTVAQNVAFPLKIRGLPKAEVDRRAREMIDLMRLQAFAGRLPRQLSGGQQQRVALARALVFNPPLLLLDEPMSALDRKLKEDLQAELKEVHRRIGTTFVHITHDQDEAMALADRVAIMQEGRIVQVGTPHELYRRPSSRFVAGFLGKSNFIEGVVQRCEASTVDVELPGTTVITGTTSVPRRIGQNVALAVRPEDITVSTGPVPEGRPNLPGVISSVLFFGKHTAIQVAVPAVGSITAYVGSDVDIPIEGDNVFVSWPVERGIVVDE